MRLRLILKADSREFPLDYRRKIIHFIKNALKSYDGNLYNRMYSFNRVKEFTFSVFFKDGKILKDKILLGEEKEITVFISIGDPVIAVSFCNAFMKQKFIKLNTNDCSLTLTSINLLKTSQIKSNKILIKLLSPLVLQVHNATSDYYYSIEHENFLDIAKEVIGNQFEKLGYKELFNKDEFSIEPTKNTRKTVVKFYEKQLECTIGELILIGKPEVLEFLYLYGMGSKRSSGFGMFEVVM